MIVEDQRTAASTMRTRLQGLGYSVAAIVSDGESAVNKATEIAPDLILMDIRLGDGIDGIEAARRIKDHSDIPVVFISAYADQALLARARSTAPAGFINKPFTTKDLLTSIDLALNVRTISRSTEPAFPPTPSPSRAPSLSLVTDGADSTADTQGSSEGIITTDSEGNVTFVNRAAENLIGWTRKDLIGRSMNQLLNSLYGIPFTKTGELIESVMGSNVDVHPGQHSVQANPCTSSEDTLSPLIDAYGHCFGVALRFNGADQAVSPSPQPKQRSDAYAQVLESALHMVPVGVVLVSDEMDLHFSNAAANKVFGPHYGLFERDGKISLSDRHSNLILHQLIAETIQPDADNSLRVIGYHSKSGRDRIEIAVSKSEPRGLEPSNLATLFLFDSREEFRADPNLLVGLYGLTSAEANIVSALLAGKQLEEIAEELDIRASTARTHLKHVFHKTGVNRQSELIHRLKTGPIGLLS